MNRKNKLKEIDIKNHPCYHFHDIINFSNILLNEKLNENISVYKILNKTPTAPKELRIMFDKIDGFIIMISLDGKIKHLVLFDYGLFDKIFDKAEHLMSKKKWYYKQY